MIDDSFRPDAKHLPAISVIFAVIIHQVLAVSFASSADATNLIKVSLLHGPVQSLHGELSPSEARVFITFQYRLAD